jgi:hypothetical protein
MDYTYLDIAKMIDHSLLNPVLTDGELEADAGWQGLTWRRRASNPTTSNAAWRLLAGSTVQASR